MRISPSGTDPAAEDSLDRTMLHIYEPGTTLLEIITLALVLACDNWDNLIVENIILAPVLASNIMCKTLWAWTCQIPGTCRGC